LLVDGAQNIEQTGLSSSGVAEDDHEFALPDIDRHSSKSSHSLQAKEISFMQVISRDYAGLVFKRVIFYL
jgi:hypothetical protein